MTDSRTHRVLKNAKIGAGFYLLAILLGFFSRKIFLDCLGADYVGLTGTLLNILGYLNLAELGFGSAVIFNLYKPIFNGNRSEINALISFYSYINRKIGFFIVIAGILFSLFFPLIFNSANISLPVVFFAFYVILGSSVISYFLNFRQIILFADQRNYLYDAINQSACVAKTLTQIFVTLKTGNYYAWVAIEGIYAIIISVILNNRITKYYPWLKCSAKEGKKVKGEFGNIILTTRKVFVHKIKDFFLTQNDQFIVFLFLSLKTVAYYGNYVMITTRIIGLINHIFAGTESSVGNLIVQNNREQIMKVFWELNAVRYFIAGVTGFALYHLMTPFISVWLGDQYILSNGIMILLVLNLFIMIIRGSVDDFNCAYGNYGDTWAAWGELGINLTITIAGGYFWGLYGILLGKTAALITIIVFWKPYYLFSKGFKESYISYWRYNIGYIFAIAVAWISGGFITDIMAPDPYESFGGWIISAIFYTLTISSILFLIIAFTCHGGHDLVNRFFKIPRHFGIKSA